MIEPRPFASTKIICTIGPATAQVDTLVRLIGAGMDVARLNFSHGTHEEHLASFRNVREASRRTGEPVAILQDLGGPKVRIGRLKNKAVEIRDGQRFIFTVDDIEGDGTRVSTTYQQLPADVHPGDVILLDDGNLSVRVASVSAREVECTVVHGGRLSEHKGMNLPGVRMSVPTLTPKDIEDVRFGLAQGVDYVALSFVRSAADLRLLRSVMRDSSSSTTAPPPIIAKIEKEEAVRDLESILEAADGVMVARGDLGVEMPPEDVPMVQKLIVRRCNAAGIPVIIATKMLESMIENPRPTRAEANDVANAVLDGADAVMLSAETSVGKFPVETVETMDRIVRTAEATLPTHLSLEVPVMQSDDQVADAVARSACMMAERVRAKVIAAVTHSGATAMRISKYRPHAMILAFTRDEGVVRRLNLVWGVRGHVVSHPLDDAESIMEHIKGEMVRKGLAGPGEYAVWTLGLPLLAKGSTNTLKVERF